MHAHATHLESYYQQIAEMIEPDTPAEEMLAIVIAVCFPDKDVALPLWKYDPKIDVDNLPDIGNAPTYSIDRLGEVLVHFLSKTILDDDFQSIYQKVYNAYLEGMEIIIQHGIASGEFREVDHEKDDSQRSCCILLQFHHLTTSPLKYKTCLIIHSFPYSVSQCCSAIIFALPF